MHCFYHDGVFLPTDKVVKVAGCAHVTAGGVVTVGGGGLDAVARGCGRVTPANRCFLCGAVKLSRHIGGRTWGWKKKEGTSHEEQNNIKNVLFQKFQKMCIPVSFSTGMLISLMHMLECPVTVKV